MTLDEDLVRAVDRAALRLGTTRSAFTREALRAALRTLETADLEEKHRAGYAAHPAGKTEFAVWENEQEWGDA